MGELVVAVVMLVAPPLLLLLAKPGVFDPRLVFLYPFSFAGSTVQQHWSV